jgi:hypothetical protein
MMVGRRRLAGIALLLLALSGCGTSEPGPVADPTAGPGAAPGRDTWRRIADGPLTPRRGHAAVWTGADILVWGGKARVDQPGELDGMRWTADGAAYDPARDRWVALPAAPIAGRERHAAAWTGTELVVWGGQRPRQGPDVHPDGAPVDLVTVADGAAYDPATHTWRTLPDAPVAGVEAIWTGRELVVWQEGSYNDQAAPLRGAAYDPSADHWRKLAPAPVPVGYARTQAVIDDGRLFVATYRDDTPPERPGCHAAIYAPTTDTWQPVDGCPVAGLSGPRAAWTGQEVALLSIGPEAYDGGQVDPYPRPVPTQSIYEPSTGSWRQPPAKPNEGTVGMFYPVPVWTGQEILLGTTAYTPAEGRWRTVPDAPFPEHREGPVQVWTGDELLLWGGATSADARSDVTFARDDGYALRPGR